MLMGWSMHLGTNKSGASEHIEFTPPIWTHTILQECGYYLCTEIIQKTSHSVYEWLDAVNGHSVLSDADDLQIGWHVQDNRNNVVFLIPGSDATFGMFDKYKNNLANLGFSVITFDSKQSFRKFLRDKAAEFDPLFLMVCSSFRD